MARPMVWWPAPRKPTSPRVSPAATANETGPDALGDEPSTESTTRSDGGGGRAKASVSERPTIICTRAAGDVSRGGDGRHAAAVAQHGDPVGDAEDLVQAMGDVDDADAAGAQAA